MSGQRSIREESGRGEEMGMVWEIEWGCMVMREGRGGGGERGERERGGGNVMVKESVGVSEDAKKLAGGVSLPHSGHGSSSGSKAGGV